MKVTDEHELKLGAPDGFELPELPGEPLEVREFTSTYYDTPPGSLRRARITLRRRVENGTGVWQLKLPSAQSRFELEPESESDALPAELERLLAAHLRLGGVSPVAELRTHRSGVLVSENGSQMQVVLDRVEVMRDGEVASVFNEIELELVAGDAASLGRVAEVVLRSGAEARDQTPKLYRALGPEQPPPPARGRRGWVAKQLAEILAHDPGTRFGADPEDLHQHRVAVRRLRAVLRDEPWKTELRWLGGALGAVRDHDVLLDHLRGQAATLEPEERFAFEPLLRRLEQERDAARHDLTTVLSASRYLDLLDALTRAAAELSEEDDAELPAVAAAQFRKLRKEVKAAGPDPADDVLHELRKRGKRLRYAAELAATVSAKGGRRVVEPAKRFQDVLGEHQDGVIAEQRLRELLGAGGDTQRRGGRRAPDRARARAPPGGAERMAAGVAGARAERRAHVAVTGPVRAAGGVVRRGDRVLVVHRPRYDDWTFPKGKADDGESDEDCAVREVREETGFSCRLVDELPSTSYTDSRGRPKVVRYWSMDVEAVSSLPRGGRRGGLVHPGEAAQLLSYDRDQPVLAAASR